MRGKRLEKKMCIGARDMVAAATPAACIVMAAPAATVELKATGMSRQMALWR